MMPFGSPSFQFSSTAIALLFWGCASAPTPMVDRAPAARVDCAFLFSEAKNGNRSAWSKREIWDLQKQAKGQLASDPEFVAGSVEAILRVLRRSKETYERNDYFAAQKLIEALISDRANHEALRSVLDHFVKRYREGSFDRILTELDIIKVYAARPEFSMDLNALVRLILDLRRDGVFDSKSLDEILVVTYRNIQDQGLQAEVLYHFLDQLGEEGHGKLPWFGSVNQVDELRKIDVALGMDGALDRLAQTTRSLNYKQWDAFKWVDNAKAITTFRTTFFLVVGQTAAVHFEIGKLLQDVKGLRSALRKVHEMGDRKAIRYLAKLYEKVEHPKIATDEISITSVELYWILTTPEFFEKTTFYRNFRPISAAKAKDLLAELTPERG